MPSLGTSKSGLGNAHVGAWNVGELGMLFEGVVSFFALEVIHLVKVVTLANSSNIIA